LKKSLPDLAAVDFDGENDQPAKTVLEIVWGGSNVSK